MKEKCLIFILALTITAPLLQAHAVKLKLDFQRIFSDDKSKTDQISQDFPPALIPNLGQYLTVTGTSITFTPHKNDACDFEVEEVVITTLGTYYYRITYHDAVLIWDAQQKQFMLISRDERINPLKAQIQWFSLLRWLNWCCGKNTMSPIQSSGIEIIPE